MSTRNLYSPAVISSIKKQYGFKLAKGLGQNFLTDIEVIQDIIYGSDIDKDSLVIEIGPGIGTLTREAAAYAGHVVAIELDSRLIPILNDTLSDFNNIEVINDDVMKVDLNRLINENCSKYSLENVRIIGNLPYYITTPIVMKLIESDIKADSITVMMQKEVGERLLAEPGTKKVGSITYSVHYYCNVSKVCDVKKDVFYPIPKVDSVVLKLDIKKEKEVELLSEKMFFRCIKAGFEQRRKTITNSLNTMPDFSKEQIQTALDKAGIAQNRRAENLTIKEFGEIANILWKELNR